MYNLEKFRYGQLKVKDLITELLKEDQDATLCICGCNITNIHVDDNVVNLDYDDLSEEYNYNDYKLDMSSKCIIPYDRSIEMLKTIVENIAMDSGEDTKQHLLDLGFDKMEIDVLYNWR